MCVCLSVMDRSNERREVKKKRQLTECSMCLSYYVYLYLSRCFHHFIHQERSFAIDLYRNKICVSYSKDELLIFIVVTVDKNSYFSFAFSLGVNCFHMFALKFQWAKTIDECAYAKT